MNANDQAVSIDEYIETHSRAMTAGELRQLRTFLPALTEKKAAAEAQHRDKLSKDIDTLSELIMSDAVELASDPLPPHLAEAAVAARYVLKGIDIIPDSLPEIGLADDEWVVNRVMERNPGLRPSAR